MTVLRIIALLTIVTLALAGTAAAQMEKPGEQPKEEVGTKVIGDGVIVPGERIGPLRLSMTIEQLLSQLPKNYKREVFDKQDVILFEWRSEGIWVSLSEQTKATRLISVFGSSSYHTDKGVQLLHPESRMVAVYGKDYKRYEYPEDRITLIRYVPLGLQFGLVNQPGNKVLHGRIFTIGIFAPGKEPPLTKQPAK